MFYHPSDKQLSFSIWPHGTSVRIGDEHSHTECPDRCGLPHAGKVTDPIGQTLHRRAEHLQHHAMLPAQPQDELRHAWTTRQSGRETCKSLSSSHDAIECMRHGFCSLHMRDSSAHARQLVQCMMVDLRSILGASGNITANYPHVSNCCEEYSTRSGRTPLA